MNVQIHAVKFTADQKLLERVQEKAKKLSTFHDRILEVEVFLKLDNVVHQIKDKIAEIKVHIPKHTFFVKHESKTFEESLDEAMKSLTNQIKHYKEKSTDSKSARSLDLVDSSIEEEDEYND
jgi:putative sigma-54 modulation protein